jgi:hypothetical protein
MSNERERVISISLSEAEWQAFVARQPQPVHWIRERIRDEVQAPSQSTSEPSLRSESAA